MQFCNADKLCRIDCLGYSSEAIAMGLILPMLPFASGRDLLVHPVTDEGSRGVTAYLPGKGEMGNLKQDNHDNINNVVPLTEGCL